MSKGYIYLLKRDKSAIKMLATVDTDGKISGPNPFSMIENEAVAKGVFETIKLNKLEWESYAENGTPQEIINRWKLKGVNLPVGKYRPTIEPKPNGSPISQTHDLGKLPTGRKPKLN